MAVLDANGVRRHLFAVTGPERADGTGRRQQALASLMRWFTLRTKRWGTWKRRQNVGKTQCLDSLQAGMHDVGERSNDIFRCLSRYRSGRYCIGGSSSRPAQASCWRSSWRYVRAGTPSPCLALSPRCRRALPPLLFLPSAVRLLLPSQSASFSNTTLYL